MIEDFFEDFPFSTLYCNYSKCINKLNKQSFIMKEPVTLLCGHSFCKICISNYLKGQCCICNFQQNDNIFNINYNLNDICNWFLKIQKEGFKCENLHNLKNKLKLESDNNEKKKSSSVNTSNSSNEDVSNSNYVVPLYGSTFMTVYYPDENLIHTTSINIEWTVGEFIKKLRRKFPIKQNCDYGIYVKSKKKWLDENKKLCIYEEDIHLAIENEVFFLKI
jgi:hypothetical protein